MAARLLTFALLATALLATATATATETSTTPFPNCRGYATYKVTFINLLTSKNFGNLIPEGGLVYSPLAAFSHSNRYSFLTIRGFPNGAVEEIAETGNNARILRRGKRARDLGRGVKSITSASGPTMPGQSTTVYLAVDCQHPFITVIGMIAPSPDWIVQLNNRNLFDQSAGGFIYRSTGDLIAYDAGVDSGREFTDPADPSLDIPTEPRQNIAPLVEDETDRFEGRVVGEYVIQRVY